MWVWCSGVLGWAEEEVMSEGHWELAKKRPASMGPSEAHRQGLGKKLNDMGVR